MLREDDPSTLPAFVSRLFVQACILLQACRTCTSGSCSSSVLSLSSAASFSLGPQATRSKLCHDRRKQATNKTSPHTRPAPRLALIVRPRHRAARCSSRFQVLSASFLACRWS